MDYVGIALAALAVVLGLRAVPFLVVLFQLLRTPITPIRISLLDAPRPWRKHEQAAVAELEAMGFRQVAWWQAERDGLSVDVTLLRHETQPVFAELTFLIPGYSGYLTTFISFATSGNLLVTSNRTAWAAVMPEPMVEGADPYADSLHAHWQAHLARLDRFAAESLTAMEAARRVIARDEAYHGRLREAGLLKSIQDQWHFTVQAALRATVSWWRIRGKLARPYRSDAISGEHAAAFQADAYSQAETFRAARSARRDVKAVLLLATGVVSWLLWSLLFGWEQGLMLMVVLFVHESGHALAMRAFGFRDMSMFFVPMLGAMVTGAATGLPAWQRAVVLLAGPVPGLVAGAALLLFSPPGAEAGIAWRSVGYMAIWINLFNLLPIVPLDGGRLLEIALSNKPRLRFAFAALSVVGFVLVGLLLESVALGIITALVAMTLMTQWRIMRLEQTWIAGSDDAAQVTHLFAAGRRLFGIDAFLRLYPLVGAVLSHRSMRPPRAWETAAVLLLFTGLWSATFLVAQAPKAWVGRFVPVVERSAAQVAFDDAYARYEQAEDDAPEMEALQRLAAALASDDARHVDLMVEQAYAEAPAQARSRLLTALVWDREGLRHSRRDVAKHALRTAHQEGLSLPPPARAELLGAAIAEVMRISPRLYPATVEARLRMAEAVDAGGDPAAALMLLEAIRVETAAKDDCRCELRNVIRAEAWFHISHRQPERALSLLEINYPAELKTPNSRLARDYAWALLAAGRTPEGIEQMRLGSYTGAYEPPLLQQLMGVRARPPALRHPLEMAHALLQAGHEPAARGLVRDVSWGCWRADPAFATETAIDPWETGRERAIQDAARRLCPGESAAATHRNVRVASR